MIRRYVVRFGKWDGREGCWNNRDVRAFRSLESATKYAQAFGERQPGMGWTLGGAGYCDSVDVVDARTGRSVWAHTGYRVPSVGELGYW